MNDFTRKEYIEREAFIADQRYLYCDNCARRKGMKNGKLKFVYDIGEAPCRACDIGDLLDAVEDYPAADVAPVRHGRWESSRPDAPMFGFHYCSICGRKRTSPQDNYCPNCGALMDKDGDGE